MDYENDHLVYPNLVSAHIKTSNVLSPSTASLPPPPPSSILKRIEESPAYQKPSLERYKFDVEREVLARAKQKNASNEEPIEIDLLDMADK
mmetsp:Transcript_30186/g.54678  ORF Transcript_30186/g.54678 Transcript_30186/m.54678 type:complete len:91 (-) Transcript_30186:284-556(-)